MRYVQSKCNVLKEKILAGELNEGEIKMELGKIVKAHNNGIDLCEQLEDILNFLMLVWYSVFTIVLCFLFFEFNIVN